MKKIHRTILFFGFTAFFALASVLVLYYAQGYRIDLTNRKITLTGGLFIKTSEPGVSIFLDDKFRKQTDFFLRRALVANLIPGEYAVRLEKTGFLPWEKKLRVEPELVTEARNILLVSGERTPETIATGTNSEFFISPDGKRIAYIRSQFLEIVDLATLRSRQTFPLEGRVEYRILDWRESPEEILLKRENQQIPLSRFSLRDQKLTLFPLPPVSVIASHWYERDILIIEYRTSPAKGKTLALVHAPSGRIEKTLVTDYAAYLRAGNSIYFIREDSRTLWRYQIDDGSLVQISPHAFATPQDETPAVIKQSGPYIAVRQNGTLFLSKDDGSFENIKEGITDFHFSSAAKTLLFLTPNELWVRYLEDIHIQPFRSKNDTMLITRFGETIDEAIWYSLDNEHVIFRVGNAVKITELDDRDRRNTVDLVTLTNQERTPANLFYHFRDEYLYFRDGNDISRLKIR